MAVAAFHCWIFPARLVFGKFDSLKFSSTENSCEFLSFAKLWNTSIASSGTLPITTGTFGLIIPPFSNAIFSWVSPRISTWSKPMDVITETIGETTFVESSLPPKPVSNIARSTFALWKCSKAMPVIHSKKVGWLFWLFSEIFSAIGSKALVASSNSYSDIGELFTFTLSPWCSRWGEQKRPVL